MLESLPLVEQGIHSLWRAFSVVPQADAQDLSELKTAERNAASACYAVDEVLQIRSALKWGTKLSTSESSGWGPNNSMPLCSHAAEVGFLLALSREKADNVAVGLLYNALDGADAQHNAAVASIMKRKFGVDIYERVVQLKSIREHPNLLATQQDGAMASMFCAIEIARHAAGLSTHPDPRSLLRLFEQANVSNVLLAQYRAEISHAIGPARPNQEPDLWTPSEVVDIRNGLRTSVWLFKDQKRRWGPAEYLPLSAHEAEVGLLAVLAGCSRDCIIAATLHDIFEDYLPLDQNYLRQVVDRFGPRVRELVQAVTEPPKKIKDDGTEHLDDWMERKRSVLDRVSQGERELAELSACTKISTLAAGNAMLYRKGSVQQWSKGPLRANLGIFIQHREAFHAVGISSLLAEQFDLELERFILISAWEPEDHPQSASAQLRKPNSRSSTEQAA